MPEEVAVAVEWKPSMSRDEAEAWARDSVFKDTVYHGTTSQQAVIGISKNGFDLSRIATGRVYGDGVYTTTSHEMASMYIGNAGEENILNIKANVSNPLVIGGDNDMGAVWDRVKEWYGQDVVYNKSEILTKYMIDQGYDALHITLHKYLIVFDPKKITVIK